jgi:hypothetical protein
MTHHRPGWRRAVWAAVVDYNPNVLPQAAEFALTKQRQQAPMHANNTPNLGVHQTGSSSESQMFSLLHPTHYSCRAKQTTSAC